MLQQSSHTHTHIPLKGAAIQKVSLPIFALDFCSGRRLLVCCLILIMDPDHLPRETAPSHGQDALPPLEAKQTSCCQLLWASTFAQI